MDAVSAAIAARGLGLRTSAGWVYRSVGLEVPPGGLARRHRTGEVRQDGPAAHPCGAHEGRRG